MPKCHRTEKGEVFSEGSRRLWLAIQKKGLTQAGATRLLQAPEGQLNRWLYGDVRPSGENSNRIKRVFKIAQELWYEEPREDFSFPAEEAA